jgi:hypothetical protein
VHPQEAMACPGEARGSGAVQAGGTSGGPSMPAAPWWPKAWARAEHAEAEVVVHTAVAMVARSSRNETTMELHDCVHGSSVFAGSERGRGEGLAEGVSELVEGLGCPLWRWLGHGDMWQGRGWVSLCMVATSTFDRTRGVR